MRKIYFFAWILSLFFLSISVAAQTASESEPNDSKATATTVTVTGTGGFTITGSATSPDVDYFKVKFPAATTGIYENLLTLTVTDGHTVVIRGINPDPQPANGAYWPVQTGSSGFVKWYGFGKQEELYISVAGSVSSTNYTLTWTRTSKTFDASANIFINSLSDIIAWSYTDPGISDTDLWIYDSNLDPVPDFGNDDQPSSSQSRLARAYPSTGDYYVAFARFDLVNDQPSASDDAFNLGIMLDFPGAVLGNSEEPFPAGTVNLNFSVNGGAETPVSFPAPPGAFNIAFAKFTVSFAVTPVSLLSFSGYREGNHNLLKWTTASEQSNKGFQVERSTDGVNYSSIGFVNSRALNGNSSSLLHYSFPDNNPASSKQYYRLRQFDMDNHEKLSTIILIKGQRPAILTLGGLFPNPASNLVNAIIEAPETDDISMVITDVNGKLIRQQSISVESGTNTIPVDISKFSRGTYMVTITCKSNCETLTGKFIKQ